MEYTTGTAVFNDWIITREIGQGATGHVYEIKKNGYGEEIRSALKVIRIPKSPSDIKAVMSEGMTQDDVTDYFKEFVDEILHEIKIMVSLKEHPNIVTYEDHCVTTHEEGIGWDILIKMELLTPLQEWQMDHPMNEKEIVRLGCEISSALSYAADHDLIHRDVKPENIFVDSFGKFKLGDFGIARTIEKTTGGLSKKGTESYMAPEVYLGKKYNAQVDIYSLGVVLYRFLNNNRLPFYPPITEKITYSDRESALMKRIQGLPIPEPVNGSAELKTVVLKACEYLPENRYASMSELHNALQNVGNPLGTIVVTPLPSKTLKPRKRWKIGIFGALILVAVFVTVIGVFHGKTKRYEVTVKDGNGSGEYKAGEKVEVVAEKTKDGQVFSKWDVSDSIEHSDETKETMKLVMPEEDVQIVAKYENKQYELTVEGGTGSGKYEAGEKIEVTADVDKHVEPFFGWEIADDIEHSDAGKETMEIVMPEEDVQIAAVYGGDTDCVVYSTDEYEKATESDETEEKRVELSQYLNCTVDEIKEVFGEPIREDWSMCVNYFIYDDYRFESMHSENNEEMISSIWLRNNSTKYELCGVRVQMSEEEAESQLLENGFSKLETGVFYNGVDRFVTLEKDSVYEENAEGVGDWKELETLRINASVLRESLHPYKTEVFQYMKCSIDKVVSDIPDLNVYEKDDQTVVAEKDGIKFEAKKTGEHLQQAVIQRILIIGEESEYCLYGITPEDSENARDYLAFGEGGSGELIDPAGSVLYLWDKQEEKRAISLTASRWKE